MAAMAASSLVMIAVGCGDDTSSNNTSGGTVEEKPGIQPPAAGDEVACSGANATLAISQIFLGDTDRDGTSNPTNGWKQYGFDLDGRQSTKASTGLCKPHAGTSPAVVYPDGNEGIDNSFGKNILPIITSLASGISAQANEAIAKGEFTIMLDMEGVGTGADCNPVLTRLYGGGNLGMAPKWDGTDKWPLLRELLTDPADAKSAKIQFPKSYIVGNTWVSGTKGTVALSLSIQGFSITLNINSAVIAVDLDAEHKSGTKGTIAGVIETEALVSEIKKVAAAFDEQFCNPDSPTLQGILEQLRGASDIMADGTQNAAADCDGISIGLGFNGKAVMLGDVAPEAPPSPNPCEPGTGGGGGMGGMGGGGGAGGK